MAQGSCNYQGVKRNFLNRFVIVDTYFSDLNSTKAKKKLEKNCVVGLGDFIIIDHRSGLGFIRS